MEAPLPEPVSNGSKRSHTSQGYKSIRDEVEVTERHAASDNSNQLHEQYNCEAPPFVAAIVGDTCPHPAWKMSPVTGHAINNL
jgi:hypothetical protein